MGLGMGPLLLSLEIWKIAVRSKGAGWACVFVFISVAQSTQRRFQAWGLLPGVDVCS